MGWSQELAGLLRRAGLGKGQPQDMMAVSGGYPSLDWLVGQLSEMETSLLAEASAPATKGELANTIGLMACVIAQILAEQHREDSKAFLPPPEESVPEV